ncbi:nucleoside deaminase [Thioalkalivibrio paradoxus]|uniref:CMP deaminase n=1 Tax=Thioalkalivibrio paradoxus ARh 1 TaxID=713585 RepID=W0DPW5_9GAMM|nr:nucleoside deaminase [Thioalkalivibrio paradoxus]AHE98910.1 CMP deaminase [Thioalkalivibrio paradoxus ARh 1]
MSSTHTTLHLPQPDWLADWLMQPPPEPEDRARMAEVVAIARANVERGCGGPFAAAVYRLDGIERISAAVNTTILSHCSAAHAELQALGLAQQRLGRHTLEPLPCVLISSSAPCTMCLGAIAWSGVRRFVFATDRSDVEAIGFDEGPPTPDWRDELARRGIETEGPLLRADGLAVLQRYVECGGPIYNGRSTRLQG